MRNRAGFLLSECLGRFGTPLDVALGSAEMTMTHGIRSLMRREGLPVPLWSIISWMEIDGNRMFVASHLWTCVSACVGHPTCFGSLILCRHHVKVACLRTGAIASAQPRIGEFSVYLYLVNIACIVAPRSAKRLTIYWSEWGLWSWPTHHHHRQRQQHFYSQCHCHCHPPHHHHSKNPTLIQALIIGMVMVYISQPQDDLQDALKILNWPVQPIVTIWFTGSYWVNNYLSIKIY